MADAPPVSPAAATELDTVIGDTAAAVLLVDLTKGEVVHANDVAQQLAPGVPLPVKLDSWGESAGLRDPAGQELAETEHPLNRLLRQQPVPGQPVSAERRSEMGASREPLWVVGVPMTGAPMLESHALVVFLAVREHQATAAVEALAQQEAALRERAVLATGLSFTVADARDPEQPLVWVNPAFTLATGYEFDEVVGHNCRFLQGPGTDRAEVARLRSALERKESVITTLLNYRKDGLAFWNQVTITPIVDAQGEVTHFVGVQSDISGRIEADRERDRALASEHAARLEAESARARLAVLAEATEALTGELDESEARARFLELVVPALGDVAFFFHLRADGSVEEHLARSHDPAQAETADAYAAEVVSMTPPDGLVASLLGSEPYRLLDDVDSPENLAVRAGFVTDPTYTERAVEGLNVASSLIVALQGRDEVRDVVVLSRTAERPPFSEDDAQLALDLGRRTGLILDNLRMYASQSRIARTLQRSLLPTLPDLPWVDIDARYLPGADDAEVGGDFYDLFEHEDHSIAVTVGDVEGHDVYAAAAMGQLKGLLRATALTQRLAPAATLEQIDKLLVWEPGPVSATPAQLSSGRLASMVFVHLEPPHHMVGDSPESEGGSWTLTLSSAGHPPPLVRLPDGDLTLVDPPHARGPLLGLGAPRRRHDGTFALPSGSVLLLYTDGLVERRGDQLDDGLDRLMVAAKEAPEDLEGFVDHLLEELMPVEPQGPDGHDDVVVIALCLRERES